jgi:hypothetical protein
MNITTFNSFNATMNHANLKSVCEVDTLKMLESINKTPEFAFWFLVGSIILLTIYLFWIEKSSNAWIEKNLKHGFVILPYLLLISSAYLYMFTTYNIDTKAFFKIVEPIIYIIAFALGVKIMWNYWKEHKGE